ncbi:MAG: transporter substrate-binding domain-containing protein [Clostridiales Family XIII bacterium]|nr:transporter substrate-binding domain-containing protein [Clostridiales Family XIII bacterium]
MNKKLILVLCIVIALTFALSACGGDKGGSGKGKLTVGMEVGYPPMEYTTEDGQTFVGFDVDVAKAIAELLGLEVEYINTAWDGIFAGLEKHQYDIIMSAVSITPERQEKYIQTAPYVANRLCIVVKSGGEQAVASPADFSGKKIAVQTATTAADSVNEMNTDGSIEVFPYEKVTQCFDDLALGRVDAVYVDSVVSAYYTKDNNEYVRSWLNDTPEPMAVTINKDNPELAAAIEAAIDTLYFNGTMAEIATKNFGEDFTEGLRVVTEEPTIPTDFKTGKK